MSADRPGPVLAVRDLDVHYGPARHRRQALTGVDLEVHAGETVGLVGETGSGKSTLARTVLGLVRSTSGQVLVQGVDVARHSSRQWRALRRRGVVQYVFQDPLRSLDPDVTVRESLLEPLLVRGDDRASALERTHALLDRVHLDQDLLDRLPGELSGGQRQRVAVARALVTEPSLVILDEPVSALDSANRVEVLGILKELRSTGVALLFISHDLGSVAGVADRMAVMYRGRLVETGDTRQVITAPQHPYSRLLLGSVPTLRSGAADRTERRALRAAVHALA
ncbi:MAG: transporter related protein [Frankiales bacterium]|nr:transporter related protein [Frankiales bacterium]